MKSGGNLFLLSRRQKSFSKQFPLIHEALADLPDNTVVDGEIVALDKSGLRADKRPKDVVREQ